MENDPEVLRAKLTLETAKVGWGELQPFFARGQTLWVSPNLDLIDIAVAVSNDDVQRIEQWQQRGELSGITDDIAKDWLQRDPALWSVVVIPWVLVQEAKPVSH